MCRHPPSVIGQVRWLHRVVYAGRCFIIAWHIWFSMHLGVLVMDKGRCSVSSGLDAILSRHVQGNADYSLIFNRMAPAWEMSILLDGIISLDASYS